MTEIIELRSNKTLINSSFEKYQFSNEVVPIISENKLENRKCHIYITKYHICNYICSIQPKNINF